jgi:hypothetical protein
MVRHFACACVGAIALSLGACGGATAEDTTEVNDSSLSQAATSATPPAPGAAGDNGERADRDDDRDRGDDSGECNDHDGEGHHHHRHHRFHVLDRLDGKQDDQITIASLPPSLPPRLIARLHEIDTNGDGIVTKAEAKAWAKAHDHHPGDRDGDSRKH